MNASRGFAVVSPAKAQATNFVAGFRCACDEQATWAPAFAGETTIELVADQRPTASSRSSSRPDAMYSM